jgi:hypothetical protein
MVPVVTIHDLLGGVALIAAHAFGLLMLMERAQLQPGVH